MSEPKGPHDEHRQAAEDSPPPGYYVVSGNARGEITLLGMWEVLWSQRYLVIAITAAFAIGSIIVSLLMTPIYRSEAVLAPVERRQSQGVAEQLGGLASLAGIRLGGESDETATTLATLRSRAFAQDFIRDHELIKVFYEDSWDAESEEWLVGPEARPTMFEAIRYFRENVFSVQENVTNGLVTLAVEWKDPETAAAWVNELVERINRAARERALRESQQNLSYLREQLEQANVVELQRAISRLIESEMSTEMLAKAREQYAFEVIDPGMVPTRRVSPHRSLIVVTTTMLGGFFALLVAFVRHSIRAELRSRSQRNGG